jgi:hypothetical protein
MNVVDLASHRDLSDDELREAIRGGAKVLLQMREALDKGAALESELPDGLSSLEVRKARAALDGEYRHGERVLLNLIQEADARGLIDSDAPIGEFR